MNQLNSTEICSNYQKIREKVKNLGNEHNKVIFFILGPIALFGKERIIMDLLKEFLFFYQTLLSVAPKNEEKVLLAEIQNDIAYLDYRLKVNNHHYIKFATSISILMVMFSIVLIFYKNQ